GDTEETADYSEEDEARQFVHYEGVLVELRLVVRLHCHFSLGGPLPHHPHCDCPTARGEESPPVI
ncbi:hypothetical protein PMAYCL1PPCAC_01354, partial [Pristionchus mayeri]